MVILYDPEYVYFHLIFIPCVDENAKKNEMWGWWDKMTNVNEKVVYF